MIASSTRKASQVTQFSTTATVSSAPPGFDSVIATVGTVSAAAISIGVFSRSRQRILRSSIRVLFDAAGKVPLQGRRTGLRNDKTRREAGRVW